MNSNSFIPIQPISPPTFAPARGAPSRPNAGSRLLLSKSAARRQLYRVGGLAVVGSVAHALTWDSDGLGLNAVLLVGAYLALALGHGLGLLPSRRWARVGLSVRVQLVVWVALAVATLWHLDPWTFVTFVLSSVTLLTAVVVGPRLDPINLLARGFLRMAAAPLAAVHFAYRSGLALDHRLRGSQRSVVRALLPALGVVAVAGLYTLSNSWLSEAWSGFGSRFWAWFTSGDIGLHLVLTLAWAAGGAGLYYRMGYVERFFTRPFWGLAAKPASEGGSGDLPMSQPDLPSATVSAADSAGVAWSAGAAAGDVSGVGWSRATVMLCCVNALAVVLNVTDAFTTWFGERATSGEGLKHGLHQGTWALSTAVVLAAAALCYLLANPTPDQHRARTLGLAWLGQNVMMVFTVALRNFHYTDAFGMTYKRLGVYLFLVCTLVGLYLLTRTVLDQTPVARLVRRQAWTIYFVLAVAALFDWPSAFTWYNLQPARQAVDRVYLAELLPFNLRTWYGLNPDYVGHLLANAAPYASLRQASEPAVDWREWDLAQARRAKLVTEFLAPQSSPQDSTH